MTTESRTGGVDAHCHIDLYPRPKDIVAGAEANGVYTIAVTNAPSVFAHTLALAKGCRFVRAALGLHPELVRTHGHELERMLQLLPETRYVGEIGLDFSTNDGEDHQRQVRVFTAILERCAAAGNKVLTVHSRRASSDVVAAFGPSFPGIVILHWFSGPMRDLNRAIEAGMYFSVNPAMAKSANGRKLTAAMPRDRVLTETDGPFVQMGGRPAAPADTGEVLAYLASLWSCSIAEAKATVLTNFLCAVGEM
jgi:TatD DNase family protein